MQKFNTDALMRPPETNRYRLDPRQSYVSREVREKDMAFWMPKSLGTPSKVPAKKPAQP